MTPGERTGSHQTFWIESVWQVLFLMHFIYSKRIIMFLLLKDRNQRPIQFKKRGWCSTSERPQLEMITRVQEFKPSQCWTHQHETLPFLTSAELGTLSALLNLNCNITKSFMHTSPLTLCTEVWNLQTSIIRFICNHSFGTLTHLYKPWLSSCGVTGGGLHVEQRFGGTHITP